VTLVTKLFDALGTTVARGMGFSDLHIHALPHPLNPLPEPKVRGIVRDHMQQVVAHLLHGGRNAS